jgi:microcystin-dependent protein
LSTTSFPALFAAIGRTYTGTTVPSNQFQVPDLRGQFLRGWDDRSSGGVDNGRAFGSSQNDSFGSHNHTIRSNTGDLSLTSFRNKKLFWVLPEAQQNSASSPANAETIDVNAPDGTGSAVQNAGGAETRPKNVALLPIIKT